MLSSFWSSVALVKDAAQLELHLLLMRGMQELRLREQPLQVLVQTLELGGRREPASLTGPSAADSSGAAMRSS